jgi:hypothetical protein
MTYDFHERLDLLGSRMKELNQITVQYTRGTQTVSIHNVNRGRTEAAEIGVHGITLIEEQQQDFVFDSSDLASFDPNTPEHGDRITDGATVFEVMTLGDRTFRYTTPTRKRIRVHTKQVK